MRFRLGRMLYRVVPRWQGRRHINRNMRHITALSTMSFHSVSKNRLRQQSIDIGVFTSA